MILDISLRGREQARRHKAKGAPEQESCRKLFPELPITGPSLLPGAAPLPRGGCRRFLASIRSYARVCSLRMAYGGNGNQLQLMGGVVAVANYRGLRPHPAGITVRIFAHR